MCNVWSFRKIGQIEVEIYPKSLLVLQGPLGLERFATRLTPVVANAWKVQAVEFLENLPN